jgi:hypothetical protein
MARYVRTQTIEHPIGADGRVVMKVASADVRLHGTDNVHAVMRATYDIAASTEADADAIFDRTRMRVAAGSGALAIEESGGSSLGDVIGRLLTSRGNVDVELELELPRRARLVLETVSGEVTAEGLRGDQRITTTSGDLYIGDAGGTLRIETVSGDMVIRAAQPVGVRAQTVSGDLALTAPRIEAMRAQTVSGDVELEGELSPAGEFRLETVSGDVAVGLLGDASFEVRGISSDIDSDIDHRIEGRLDRRRLVIGSGEPTVIFSSMSGDLAVRRPRRIVLATAAEVPAPPSRALDEAEQMAVLEALERGEISVEEATRRLSGAETDA